MYFLGRVTGPWDASEKSLSRCRLRGIWRVLRLDSDTPMRYNMRMEYATIFSEIVNYYDPTLNEPLPAIWYCAFPFYRLSVLAHTSACMLPRA